MSVDTESHSLIFEALTHKGRCPDCGSAVLHIPHAESAKARGSVQGQATVLGQVSLSMLLMLGPASMDPQRPWVAYLSPQAFKAFYCEKGASFAETFAPMRLFEREGFYVVVAPPTFNETLRARGLKPLKTYGCAYQGPDGEVTVFPSVLSKGWIEIKSYEPRFARVRRGAL